MNAYGIVGLALFLVGTSAAFGMSARETLADVPWQYMPSETASASVGLYTATFIPVAEQYLVALDGIAEIQADAYKTTGKGLAAVAAILGDTKPAAAVGQWYMDSSTRVNARLSP